MKNRTYRIIILILSILLLLSSLYIAINVYPTNYNRIIYSNVFTDVKRVEVWIAEVGSASILGGDSKAEIFIYNLEKKKDTKDITIGINVSNGGNKLTMDNFEITSNDEYIKIEVINEDGSLNVYRIYYEDLDY